MMSDAQWPLGLRVPIFQAPTGSIAGPELATAVSQAGGLGAMALTWTDPASASELVNQIRAATDLPFQVNFALAFPPAALSAALDAGAPVVTFSWGDPAAYVCDVRSAGAKFGVQVTNVTGARYALDLGADFLICQGLEAGGHVQSTTPLQDLLPRIISEAGAVPVIASGGIGDGRGIAAALAAGAAAAMLGTRFVATTESRAHPNYKAALLRASALDVALTVCFDGDWPYAAHRVLRNSTLEAWEAAGCPSAGHRPGEGDEVGRTAEGDVIRRYSDIAPRAGMTGHAEEMCLYAGMSCGQIDDVPSAAELVARLWDECRRTIAERIR